MSFEPKEVDITSTLPPFKEPRLAPDERLYVDSYFLTFNHALAHEAVNPDLKNYLSKNTYSKRESVQYHINKRVVKRSQAMALDSDTVLDLLLQEATRLGNGSSPTARVQALTLLGKEMGLFEEKKDVKDDIVFNIVSYGSADSIKIEKKEEEVIEAPEVPPETLGISVTSYTGEDNGDSA